MTWSWLFVEVGMKTSHRQLNSELEQSKRHQPVLFPRVYSRGGMLQPKLCDFDAARVIAEEIACLGVLWMCHSSSCETNRSRFFPCFVGPSHIAVSRMVKHPSFAPRPVCKEC
eukprot:909350-Amphidinium_carterae.1